MSGYWGVPFDLILIDQMIKYPPELQEDNFGEI
jgi:hypothetical protein